MRGGSASRSRSRSSSRSFSDNTGVILEGLGGKLDPHDGSRGVVLEQALLVRLDEQALDGSPRQEEQAPVRVADESLAGGPAPPEAKGDVGEGRRRQSRRGQALAGGPAQDSEVAQGAEQSL